MMMSARGLVSFPLASFSLSNLGPEQIHGAAPHHNKQVLDRQSYRNIYGQVITFALSQTLGFIYPTHNLFNEWQDC